jgi:hypothetical protein
MSDPGRPISLADVDSEIEAGAIVSALEAAGIEARIVGDFTSGFRAEAPGQVSVVVREADAERASSILAELHAENEDSDN